MTHDIMARIGQALLLAAGMAWKTGWSLVLGFAISGLLQAIVSADEMRRALGRAGPKEIAIATAAGAASSSCSYASASIVNTLFKKGAALAPSLAFLFASTNLVLELGLTLLLLLGWPFMAGEWVGGIVLVVVMSLIVKLTYPAKLVEAARHHDSTGGHDHAAMAAKGATWRERLRNPQTRVIVAQTFAMDWSMLWKDLLIGFLAAGFLAAFVPDAVWKSLFLTDASPWLQLPANALMGPLVAIVTFVCSIGNVPLAAVLWGGGASFGGVLAFLYADLIVLPLLDVYRRYFGWRMAAYIGLVFYATMAISALLVDLAFTALGLAPKPDPGIRAEITHFAVDYTFWLNLVFGALAIYLVVVARRHPMEHGGHEHHGHHGGSHAGHGHAAE